MVLDTICLYLRILLDAIANFIFAKFSKGKEKPLPSITNPLLTLSATQLTEKLKKKQITSEELTKLCIERILQINPILNCVVDQRYEEALEEACEVDKQLGNLSEEQIEELFNKKPLLGLPLSTKEGIKVKGCEQISYGLPARRNYVPVENAVSVQLLRDNGAIPLCITNVPELGTFWESSNYVYGTTKNPYNISRTPGGSSGGEAALQSAAGICLSLGSDTGGSLRMPALFCGLFTHKPSPYLTSVVGTDVYDRSEPDLQTVGPLCRYSEDLITMMKVLIGHENTKKLKLDEQVNLKRLKYFYLDCSIGSPFMVSPVSSAIHDSISRVINDLRTDLGVEVKPLNLPEFREGVGMFFEAMDKQSHGAPTFAEFLTNFQGKTSAFHEWFKYFFHRNQREHIFPCLVNLSMESTDLFLQKVQQFLPFNLVKKGQKLLMAEKLKEKLKTILGDDGVLICPTHPTVARYHFSTYLTPMNFVYAGIFNVLQFPSSCAPIGLDPETQMPLGIQVVASTNNDRLTLEVVKKLEKTFGGWKLP